MSTGKSEKILKPLHKTTKSFYIALLILLVVTGWFVFAWWIQLSQGLMVTGLREPGTPAGAPWGIYISSFIWYIGIAHGGVVISAGARLMRLERYKVIARAAEMLTIVTLMGAGLSIVFDLGRPDNMFNLILYLWQGIHSSPLSWDLIMIVTYFVLTLTYIVLTMRQDALILIDKTTSRWRKIIYRLVLLGYNPKEKEKIDKITWWLALTILIVAIGNIHGGVIPWIFSLLPGRVGWFGAFQGPSFLLAALSTAIAAVTVLAALLRKLFNLNEEINEEVFRGLSKALVLLLLIYLWLMLHEHLVAQYAGPIAEKSLSTVLLFGEFAPMYWGVVVIGLILPMIYLCAQALNPKLFSFIGTAFASLVILVAFWAKRFLIVVPSLLYSYSAWLPYSSGSYTPTWIEVSLIAGSLAISSITYMLFVKVIPLIELKEE